MISIRREVRRINRLAPKRRIRHNCSHRSAQPHGERLQQIIRRLINKTPLQILGIEQPAEMTGCSLLQG